MDDMDMPPRNPWARPVDDSSPVTPSNVGAAPPPPPPLPADLTRAMPAWAPPTAAPAAAMANPVPRSSRPRWPIAVACLGLLTAGGIAVAVVSGGEDDDADQATQLVEIEPVATTIADESLVGQVATTQPSSTEPVDVVAPDAFSLDAARQASFDSEPQRMRITTTSMGAEMVIDGELDANDRMRLTTSSGFDESSVDFILDIAGGVAYYRGADFDEMLTGDAEWLAMDLESTMAVTGQSLDGLRQMLGGVPATELPNEPVQIGFEDIDGEQTMHYRLAVTSDQFADMLGQLPQFVPEGAAVEMMSQVDDITYDFYVTEANFLRRMEMQMTMSGTSSHTVYDVWPLDPSYSIALPDPSTVQSIDDF